MVCGESEGGSRVVHFLLSTQFECTSPPLTTWRLCTFGPTPQRLIATQAHHSVMQRPFSNAAQPRTVSRNGLFRSVWVFATFTWSDCRHLSSGQILTVARQVQLTGLQVTLPNVNSPCMQSRLCCLSRRLVQQSSRVGAMQP